MKVILVPIFIFAAILGLLIVFSMNDITLTGVAEATDSPLISQFDGTTELVSFMPIIIPIIFVVIVGVGIWSYIKSK